MTIAIPAYNRPEMLAEALASIAQQTVKIPMEVIVCDDGRLEETRAMVAGYSREDYIYVANGETIGAVANWNKCLALARGEFVMVLHEDDALYPWCLESLLPQLRGDVAAVCMKTSRGAVQPVIRRPAPAAVRGIQAGILPEERDDPFPASSCAARPRSASAGSRTRNGAR